VVNTIGFYSCLKSLKNSYPNYEIFSCNYVSEFLNSLSNFVAIINLKFIIMKKVIISMLLAIAMSFGAVVAQSTQSMSKKSESAMTQDKSSWVQVCEKKVSLKAGHDELMIKDSNKFQAIKVKAGDQPITITDVKLFYKSGATQDISLNTALSANGVTKAIDLSGASQVITKIDFKYKSPEGMTSMKEDNTKLTVMGLEASPGTASR